MNFKPGDKVFINVSQDIYSYTWGRCEGTVIEKDYTSFRKKASKEYILSQCKMVN
ncbi:hypothetical protein [Inconstantimicrobium porci]|uniref:hypothetical protein n=1 Tax=Inconstantimicrobium porci TaxID=2652291 RepID=UPI00240949FF|nr:hypothetical protein [Inconstantimicrobium porci]MDD6769710.1 hypothetical protein [Inconstantimicrobium porci]